MPEPSEFDNQDDFMAACVPMRVKEGDTQEQAVGACMGIWDEHTKATKSEPAVTTGAEIVGSIKALEDWELDVLGMPYGGHFFGKDEHGDFFSPNTKTHLSDTRLPIVTYRHGLPVDGKPQSEPEIIGVVKSYEQKEDGWHFKVLLDKASEFAQTTWDAAKKGLARASSGAMWNLIRRAANGEILNWPIDELTIFDSTANYRPANQFAIATPAIKALYEKAGLDYATNPVIPLKSLSDMLPPIPDNLQANPETGGDPVGSEGATVKAIPPLESMEGTNTMEITEEKFLELQTSAVKEGVEQALKALPAPPPPVSTVEVISDPADHPFEDVATQCRAIKTAELSKGRDYADRLRHPSIKGVAGTGASEAVPSEAGYLLEPTFTSTILKPLHEQGPFTQDVSYLPVGSNSNSGWINGVDETNRATGSRWGGIQGYRLAEGDIFTGSKPKFRRINWELRKYGILVYGTDELLADVSQFSAIVNQGCGEEFNFMANDDILNGLGTNGPLGVLATSAYVSITKETNQAADTIVVENLSKMWARLDSRAKQNAKWYINTDCNPQLDSLALSVGTGALEPRFVAYGPDGIMRIKGRPVVETEFSPSIGDAGCIFVADMSQYLFWEKGGVQAASSIHVAFVTDETAFRFTYRCYGCPAISTVLTPYKGTSNTISPFVALGTV